MLRFSKDKVFATVCIVIAAVLAVIVFSYPLESSYFPRILVVFIGAMGSLLLARHSLQKTVVKAAENFNQYKVQLNSATLVFSSIAAYTLSIYLVNYEIATALFLFFFMLALGYRKIAVMVATSLSLTFSLYLIFFEILAVARPDSLFFT
ncbi:MAG: tripartite tricarboxylate transporter TctB family protein [Oceanospirillaceae bacterium]|nr:tripartite tricarboxylate transporter TctB family protein [Oceanospirillaceae bacterium]